MRLLCSQRQNSKICLILREVFLLDAETFGRAEAKSHQMNNALEWRAGCKESQKRVQRQ